MISRVAEVLAPQTQNDEDVRRKELIRALHHNDHAPEAAHAFATVGYFVLVALIIWSWQAGIWPVTILLWGVAGHLGHSKLIAFHESSHGTLSPRFFMNEIQGIFIGAVIFVPLSAYRYVHGQHHAYIGTERDLELWPFVLPKVKRHWRVLAAIGELVFGFFYTPVVFLHGVMVGGNIPRAQKIRLVWEYAMCVVVWISVLSIVAYKGWWMQFLVGYMAPSIIAGNLQSLRKLTEHLGLLGDTILTTTRTVVDEKLVGRLMSESMLHIDYHGTHHRYAKLPYYNLPAATEFVYEDNSARVPIFPNYLSAMLDMVRGLGNPRVGAQWLKAWHAEETPHSRRKALSNARRTRKAHQIARNHIAPVSGRIRGGIHERESEVIERVSPPGR